MPKRSRAECQPRKTTARVPDASNEFLVLPWAPVSLSHASQRTVRACVSGAAGAAEEQLPPPAATADMDAGSRVASASDVMVSQSKGAIPGREKAWRCRGVPVQSLWQRCCFL